MSAGMSGSGPSGSGGQDFELNLASIIDCFTVLIAFMLASASFLSIGILDAGVAAAGAQAATSDKPPSVNLTVELAKDHKMVLKLSGKSTSNTPIEAKSGAWNYEELGRSLASTKGRFSDLNAVTLTADNSIEYKDVVKAMEAIRKTIPVVLLGGF
jgi:biopolymer transport protein ExbD